MDSVSLLQQNFDFPAVRNAFTTRQNEQGQIKKYFPPPVGMVPKGLGYNSRRNPVDRNSMELSNDYTSSTTLTRYKPKLNILGQEFLKSERTAISQTTQSRNKMLPTLGLQRYKNIDLQVNRLNPFSINSNTEEQLIQQERQRSQDIFEKINCNSQNVIDKI